ncbi:MAG: 4Fe-4S binding protein [Dehalococcoidales bacterium]|nr:4Fe-4S binding protein [Dehalococcoidales bacterium]
MAVTDAVFQQLAEKYRLAGDDYFLELLATVMTPEEGKYLLGLEAPLTPAELAQKLNLDAQAVAEKLDNLARRGLVFRGQTSYLAWMDSHQLKARIMFSKDEYTAPGYLELRRREMRYASSPYAEINLWLKMYERTKSPLIRILPARKAIAANPDIKPGQVLWYEDVAEMMKRADKIGVVDCDCRRIYQRCDKPLFNCIHTGKNMVEYETGRDGRMREISVEEAIAAFDEAEEAGLVHNTPGNFAAMTGVICNCCNDCCSTFEPAIQSGRLNEVAAPSRFRPRVREELCKGCQTCLKRCPFEAIEMVPVPNSKKMVASVNNDKCLGCGVCVIGCKTGALLYELVRPPSFIPPKPKMGAPMVYSTL